MSNLALTQRDLEDLAATLDALNKINGVFKGTISLYSSYVDKTFRFAVEYDDDLGLHKITALTVIE